MKSVSACLVLLVFASTYDIRGRLTEALQARSPHSPVVAADPDLLEHFKSRFEEGATAHNNKDIDGVLDFFASDAKKYSEGKCSNVYHYNELKDWIQFPPDGEGDILNFLEDTLELEILSSDEGLVLSVSYWEFVIPNHSAPNIRMRVVGIWQLYDNGRYYLVREFISECDV